MSSNILKSLEETFGAIPSYINEHLKYFTFNSTNEEFQCVLCDEIVKKVSMNQNSTAKNFKAHIFSRSHKELSSSLDEIVEALSKTFEGKIPQVVLNNIYVLDKYEQDYKCIICDKILEVRSSPSSTQNGFSYHLLSSGHIEKWDEHRSTGGELQEIFGRIPEPVKNNQEFLRLTRSGKNFVCTACNVLLIVDEYDLKNTTDRFKDHFCSSEHIRSSQISKVFSLLPTMENSNLVVPSYLTRNIDYIITSGTDGFCKLCNKTIKYDQHDISVTAQNLKLHILSPDHEENLYSRLKLDHDIFDNLNIIIEEFTDVMLRNLRYLCLNEESLSCSICDVDFSLGENHEEIKGNIMDHFESDIHRNTLHEEIERRNSLTQNLEDLFGGIPSMIQENISYLEFKGGKNFQCTLCDATLQTVKNTDVEHVARVTQENFERHLGMSKHTEAIANKDHMSVLMQTELESLFDPIPQFITQNWDHIQYDNESFFCVLCDQHIIIDNGNKKEELTLQNFRTHLFSAGHTSNLETKAKKESVVNERLKSIFGGIPCCILSNLEYLFENENSFFCDACDVEIRLGSCSDTSLKNFSQHLTGFRHKSNLKDIESSIDSAFQFLDNNFCVPEFLLKDIDFWENSNNDLYCSLCQDILNIDYDDLKQSRQSLRCHVESERHKFNLKHL